MCSSDSIMVSGQCVKASSGVDCDNQNMIKGCKKCMKFSSVFNPKGETRCMECDTGYHHNSKDGHCEAVASTACYDASTKAAKGSGGMWIGMDKDADGKEVCVEKCPEQSEENTKSMRCECPKHTHEKWENNKRTCHCPEGS